MSARVTRRTARRGLSVTVQERATGTVYAATILDYGQRLIRVRALDGSWHEYAATHVTLHQRETITR